jgi:O-antigen ligase
MTATLFRAVLLASLAALPPLALLGSPAATVVLAVDAIAALAVILPQARAALAAAATADRRMLAALLALPLIGLVSALWSLDAAESALRALKLMALLAAGLAVMAAVRGPGRPDPGHVLVAVLAGLAVAAGMALTDRFLLFEVLDELEPGFQPRRGFYSRGATVLLLFAWLAVLGLDRRGRGALAAVIYVGVGLLAALKFHSGAAATVWVLGGAVYIAWRLTRGRWRLGFAAALAAACLAAPVLVVAIPAPDTLNAANRALPSSWSHRIVIWRFAAERIAERPLLGWGLDAARRIPGGRATIPWQMDPDPRDAGSRMTSVQLMPLHPHSFALQVWLELGVPGALALATLAFLLVARAGGRDEAATGAARAALVYAGIAISSVSYGAWQTWWLSTLFVTAAAAAALAPARRR